MAERDLREQRKNTSRVFPMRMRRFVNEDELPHWVRQLRRIAKDGILEKENRMQYFWEHTRSEDSFNVIREALQLFAEIDEVLVEWVPSDEDIGFWSQEPDGHRTVEPYNLEDMGKF